jgi:hypothetical protein
MNHWAPLPGITRLGLNRWPLVRPGRWAWLDAALVVPMGLALVLVGLPVVAFVERRERRAKT